MQASILCIHNQAIPSPTFCQLNKKDKMLEKAKKAGI
jgi:hypothetical protein